MGDLGTHSPQTGGDCCKHHKRRSVRVEIEGPRGNQREVPEDLRPPWQQGASLAKPRRRKWPVDSPRAEANLHSRDSRDRDSLRLLDSIASVQRSIWTSVSATGRGLPRIFLCFLARFGGLVLAHKMSWAASHFCLCPGTFCVGSMLSAS